MKGGGGGIGRVGPVVDSRKISKEADWKADIDLVL